MTKFVGGVLDGRVMDIHERDREYVFNEIVEPIEVTDGVMSDTLTTVRRHVYTRRTLPFRFPDGRYDSVRFFAPADWSDFQAVKHQFEK